MKIGKSELKALIKECLVELLAEGLGSNLTESVKAAARSSGPRNRDEEPLPGMRVAPRSQQASSRQAQLDERVAPRRAPAPMAVSPEISAITRDPVMAAIFADTAQTTLREQASRGHSGPSRSGQDSDGAYVSGGDAAGLVVSQHAPEELFEGADRWARAAFAGQDPEPAGQPKQAQARPAMRPAVPALPARSPLEDLGHDPYADIR